MDVLLQLTDQTMVRLKCWLLVVEAAEAWIWEVEEVVEVYCTFQPCNLTQALLIQLQWVSADMEHLRVEEEFVQMVLVHNPTIINLQSGEPMEEIHHLQEELLWVVDMVQVHTGVIHPTLDMLDPVVVEAEHLDIVTVQAMVVQLVLVDVEVLQLNQHPHMAVMETEAVVELDNIIRVVVAALVVEAVKELRVVLLLVEMELKFQF
jgi:hypothetical protein